MVERLKELDDDEIIGKNICPDCLRKENKIVKLRPSGSCFDCIECGFSICK